MGGQVLHSTWTIYCIQAALGKGMLLWKGFSSTEGNSLKEIQVRPNNWQHSHQCRWILSPEGGIWTANHNIYCTALVCTCQISALFFPCLFFLSPALTSSNIVCILFIHFVYYMSPCLYRIQDCPKRITWANCFLKECNPREQGLG